MAAEIEAKPVALLGARKAADELLALDNGHAAPALGEVQRCCEASRTGP
jgi:hypothetical protein